LRCTGCGECCRGLRVPLTLADLRRLGSATGLGAAELVEWAPPDEVDISGEPGSLVLLPQGRRVMLLAQRDGSCRFLDVESRCTVHAARPAACRAYPLHASFGERGGVKRLRVLRGIDCRYELAGPPELAAIRREHLALRRELAAHHEAVASFNRSQTLRRRLGKRLATAEGFFSSCAVGAIAGGAQPQLSQPIRDMPMQP